MGTVKDLRDLINVSRLTYRDSDNEDEYNDYYNENLISLKAATNGKQFPRPILSSTTTANGPFVRPTFVSQHQDSSSTYFKKASASIVLLDRASIPNGVSTLYNKKPKLPPLPSRRSVIEPLNNTSLSDSLDCSSRDKFRTELRLNLEDLENEDENGAKQQQQQQRRRDVDPSDELNGNFDNILTYIDASIVTEWLNRANRYLKKMFKWHQTFDTGNKHVLKHESFVLFADFWLGSSSSSADTESSKQHLSDKQRRQLIEMEYSIIQDEVIQAFQVGLDSHEINLNDVFKLLRAVFKEYPVKLMSFRGNYLLLDYIDILSSDRNDPNYKRLLSDVKCRTVNKQFAQWLLSIRSFALINMCWAVVRFFRKTQLNFVARHAQKSRQTSPPSASSRPCGSARVNKLVADQATKINDLNSRMSRLSARDQQQKQETTGSSESSSNESESSEDTEFNEIDLKVLPTQNRYEVYLESVYKNDLPDVLHYMIVTDKCELTRKDEHNRNLIFLAVMQDKPKILNYLVKRWPSIDINEPCDSGNTALHAAVNKGDQKLVEILLKSLENSSNDDDHDESEQARVSSGTTRRRNNKSHRLDVNKTNEKCMNATALHLAVWNDFNDIAMMLMRAGADPHLKMNDISDAFDLTIENSNTLLYELLKDFVRQQKAF